MTKKYTCNRPLLHISQSYGHSQPPVSQMLYASLLVPVMESDQLDHLNPLSLLATSLDPFD
jgi:hypothetical protein